MNLPFFIARRYLFAKKSHNVINIISIISAIGIAVGAGALIIIMSIFNGLNSLIESLHSNYEPDIKIESKYNKVFSLDGNTFDFIKDQSGLSGFYPVIEDNVFLKYGDAQSVATIKGVKPDYPEETKLKSFIKEGEFRLKDGDIEEAVIGQVLAYTMGIKSYFLTPLELYFPNRKENISILNPTSSMKKEIVFPSGIISVEQNFDKRYLFIPLEVAQRLLDYKNEVSYIELYFNNLPGSSDNLSLSEKDKIINKIASNIGERLGEDYNVLNRIQQNESLYKIIQSEKLSIYIILFFIIFIISCNIFGSLSMLIIEKREDINTLKHLGAPDSTIKKIFLIEGWLISVLGIIIGVSIGVIIALIQQYLGIIKMPGNFIVESYPVVLKFTDILITICGCGSIGFLIAILPLRFTR